MQTEHHTEEAVWLAGGELGGDFICLRRVSVCGYRCHMGRLRLSTLFARAKEITRERLCGTCQSSEPVRVDKAGLQPEQIKFQEELSRLQLTYPSRKVTREGAIGWRKRHHQRWLTPGSAERRAEAATGTETPPLKVYILTLMPAFSQPKGILIHLFTILYHIPNACISRLP